MSLWPPRNGSQSAISFLLSSSSLSLAQDVSAAKNPPNNWSGLRRKHALANDHNMHFFVAHTALRMARKGKKKVVTALYLRAVGLKEEDDDEGGEREKGKEEEA